MTHSAVLSDIETKIAQLSDEEQLWLIERLATLLRDRREKHQTISPHQLTAMASDPEIQRELKQIDKEFGATESDGLENV